MTVKELIAELSKYDRGAKVVLPGYEDYYDEVDTVEEIHLAWDAFKPTSWGGKHIDANSTEGREAIAKVPTRPIMGGVLLTYSKRQG